MYTDRVRTLLKGGYQDHCELQKLKCSSLTQHSHINQALLPPGVTPAQEPCPPYAWQLEGSLSSDAARAGFLPVQISSITCWL